jgi:hypothetical protein
MGKLSQWAQNLIDHAMRCPECDHKEFEMDCTCTDEICLCFAERTAAETNEMERNDHDRPDTA